MGEILRVDTALLAGDGHGLADSRLSITPPTAISPAADPISEEMTALLAAHSTALAAVIEHSGGLRVHGGAVLVHAASVLFDADAHWAAVIGGTRSAGGAGPPGVGVPDAPQKVTPSQMPAPVGTPGVTGEQFSVYVHSGAGSALLRDFAEAWLTHATGLEGLSERVHSNGLSIDEHWSGGQRAGANTREHGEWLGNGADQARLVARTADALATQFDAAKAATPTPPLSAAPEIARTDAQALSQGLLGGAKEHLGADGDEIDPNTGGPVHGSQPLPVGLTEFDPDTGGRR